MVLRTCQMQRVGHPQSEAGTQPCRLQMRRFRHSERHEEPEQLGLGTFQDRVAAPDPPDQAFAFDQRRDAKAGSLGARHGVGDRGRSVPRASFSLDRGVDLLDGPPRIVGQGVALEPIEDRLSAAGGFIAFNS